MSKRICGGTCLFGTLEYAKIAKLLNFCRKPTGKNEKGLDLEKIVQVTDQRGFINGTASCKLQRKNIYYTEYKFYDTIE